MALLKAPKGWRWTKVRTIDGDILPLLTTDLRTKKGKGILKKAYQLMNEDPH